MIFVKIKAAENLGMYKRIGTLSFEKEIIPKPGCLRALTFINLKSA